MFLAVDRVMRKYRYRTKEVLSTHSQGVATDHKLDPEHLTIFMSQCHLWHHCQNSDSDKYSL